MTNEEAEESDGNEATESKIEDEDDERRIKKEVIMAKTMAMTLLMMFD